MLCQLNATIGVLFRCSGESRPKDQVALQWLHYYYTSLSYWCTAAQSIEIVQYARTISQHTVGISRYSVLASTSPLLPLLQWMEVSRITFSTYWH